MKRNMRNFRVFGPDESASNKASGELSSGRVASTSYECQ